MPLDALKTALLDLLFELRSSDVRLILEVATDSFSNKNP
jgi:hypothetical protein